MDLQNGLLRPIPALSGIWRLLFFLLLLSLPCKPPAASLLQQPASRVSSPAQPASFLFPPVQQNQPAGHPDSPSLRRCAARNGWCPGSAPAPVFQIVQGLR